MRITNSIRWRLQLWLAFLLVSILTGFGVTAYQLHRTNRLSQIDDALGRRLAVLSSEVRARLPAGPRGRGPFEHEGGHKGGEGDFGPPPHRPPQGFDDNGPSPDFRGGRPFWRRGEAELMKGPGRSGFRPEPPPVSLSIRTQSLFDASDANGFYFAVWSRSGVLLNQSTNAPARLVQPQQQGTDTRPHTRMSEQSRESYHFTELGECVLVGYPARELLASLGRFAWLLAGAGGAVLALGLGGGWLLVTRAIRPVEAISVAAGRISSGNLAERINIADTDSELGRLADVLNSTFARLEASFAQQKQFTADASHELRTPISVIISEAQTVLHQERSAGEYRESVQVCLEAAQQMKKLTQSLLQLARYDAGQEPMQREPLDLAEQTRACLELVRPLAKARGLTISCDLAPAQTQGDAERLSQVINNLLANAIFYNRDQGEISVSTRSEKEGVMLTVQDTGQGISPVDLPHIFERFYRGDKSRALSRGNHGLGLSICKSIVDAHGGRIEVSSAKGVGSTFVLLLPR